ncbi:MAG: methylated-DNA--[protein]-cysteine S-methyltransferase [Planctomycetota bacterium]
MTEEAIIETPIGRFVAVAKDGAVTSLTRAVSPAATRQGSESPVIHELGAQLAAYFDGKLHAFDLPLAPKGTPFQQTVWAELLKIPFGQTLTYGDIADRLGKHGASRAVGAANGANPIPIVIPCHRVVAAGGKIGGYSGGGPDVKRKLLGLEQGSLFPV